MKRILVPTDFSHVAQNALNFAIEIASKTGSEVLLYHAYEVDKKSSYKWSSSNDSQDKIKDLEGQMSSLVEKYDKIIKKREVSLKSKVVQQPISSLFENIVEKHEVDLIIMGSKGVSGLQKMIFGSVATHAMDESKAPVIVVPPNKPHLSVEQTLLTLDLNNFHADALTPFKALVSEIGANVTVLNINDGKTNEEGLQRIKGFLEGINSTYKQAPLSESINQSIDDIINSNNYDLLCMIRRKKGFWESLFQRSITSTQIERTPIPLMVLPEK